MEKFSLKTLLLLALIAIVQMARGEVEVDIEHLEKDILEKLRSPNDSILEADAKLLVAQFLTETVVDSNDDVVFYRRDKEKNRVRDQNKHKPHLDYRFPASSPIVSNQVQESPVVSQVQAVPAVSAVQSNPVVQQVSVANSESQARQDVSTQVPILTQPPALASIAPGAALVTAPTLAALPTIQPAATAPVVTIPTLPPITRPTVSPEHVYNQVDKILGSVATGNIVGIVDESLAIRAPVPVRNFVTGILKVIFCNPLDRLFGRCRPNNTGAISSVQGG